MIVKILDFLRGLTILFTLVGFTTWNIMFYMAPSEPDAVNTEPTSVYMSTANKTAVAYMSPTRLRIYDALGNAQALSFVAFFVFTIASAWLGKRGKS